MYNPNYLIKSRHDIFYFRYPLPIKALGDKSRVCISLRTRCPKEALRLAKALEYHSLAVVSQMDWDHMDHAEIMAIMKTYYAEALEQAKARIDKGGPMPKEKVRLMEGTVDFLNEAIQEGVDNLSELLETEYEKSEQDTLKRDIQQIMDKNGLSFDPDSREYGMMKAAHKHLQRNYIKDLLAYNDSVTNFSLMETAQGKIRTSAINSQHKLGEVIASYLKETKPGLSDRSYKEQRDCLAYLSDWVGNDFPVSKIDDAKAREVKELLRVTPTGRNKSKLTSGRPLLEQAAIAKEHSLTTLSTTSINKYLAYFEGLFNWAKRNRYIGENPFDGIRVKAERKRDRHRENFTKDEIGRIIAGLDDAKRVKNKSNYWGALIAVYTGARRNEIAGLLPDDVKQDADTGIWYFDITDEEEEGKSLKTEAAKRIIPVHSRLLALGFLDFVEKSRSVKGKSKSKISDDLEPRLLYDLTYTEHEKWGRNLGRWFNGSYLEDLGLKTKKKTLHSLRHSFITYLSAAGVEVATIKSIVGHEPDTVTSQIYTHYGVEHLSIFQKAIEKLPY